MLHIVDAIKNVTKVLTDDLLSPKERAKRQQYMNPPRLMGHCYVAAEAVFHLAGGRRSGLKPMVYRYKADCTHWWLVGPDKGFGVELLDPTWTQFTENTEETLFSRDIMHFIHAHGRHAAFLTKEPSKRAAEVIRRVRSNLKRDALKRTLTTAETKPRSSEDLPKETE